MNLYYAWWADSIIRIRRHNPRMKDWRVRIFQLNTLLNSLKFWCVFVWLKYLDIYAIPILSVDVFPGDLLDKGCVYMIEFLSPFMLLNYLLVFRGKRYEKIISQYKDKKLNIALPYALVSIFLYVVTVIVYALCWG